MVTYARDDIISARTIAKKLKKIIKLPELEKILDNKNGYNFSGCRKMYADGKKYE